MKAFLLAAGQGTRLKPHTDTRPKCLMSIHGTPLLRIWLDLLERWKIDAVLINTHHHADQVAQFVDQQRPHTAMQLRIAHEPHLLGSAGTLWRNREFVADQTDFIIAYADNLTNLNLGKLIDFHRVFRCMGGVLTMGLIHAPDPTQCGIVTLNEEHRVVGFEEKPNMPKSDLANAGIYVADQGIFDFFEGLSLDHSSAVDIGHHLLPRLIGRMYAVPVEGYLKDIGTPEAYRQALAQWPV